MNAQFLTLPNRHYSRGNLFFVGELDVKIDCAGLNIARRGRGPDHPGEPIALEAIAAAWSGLDYPPEPRTFAGPATGLLLLDADFNPVYVNSEATRILIYPEAPPEAERRQTLVLEKIRSILIDHRTPGDPTLVPQFLSGRRRYLCRSFPVERFPAAPMANVHRVGLLERPRQRWFDTQQIAERYRLSQREREAMELLACGFSAKEIAARMRVSPNTVKSFLRIIAAKVGANGRSGLMKRIFEYA